MFSNSGFSGLRVLSASNPRIRVFSFESTPRQLAFQKIHTVIQGDAQTILTDLPKVAGTNDLTAEVDLISQGS